MKKIITLLLVVSMVVSVAACGGTTKTIEESTSAAAAAAAGDTKAGDSTVSEGESTAAGQAETLSPSDIDTTGFLNVALNANIDTADVHKTSADYMLPLNIFDRLLDVEVDESGESKLVPALAQSWDVSEDGLTYTLHLRKGIMFTNGDEFKASDCVYSLTRILGVTGATNGDFVSMIEGADKVMDATATELSGVKALDDYTVEIKLSKPYGGFLACLTTPPVVMLSEKATEAAGDSFGIDPSVTIGTGPFKLAAWTLNDSIVLTRNDNYWKGTPSLPGIVVRIIPDAQTQSMMFETGELDVLDFEYQENTLNSYREKYPDQIVSAPRVGILYFTFNENIEALGNAKVREAISMAVDRQAILDGIWDGEGQVENGIFPKGAIGHSEDIEKIDYDPEQAKALLAEAGYPDGFDMEISVDTSASDKVNQTLEVIAEELSQIGINATIKQYDQSTWLDTRKAGELGSFMATWSADYNDPDNFIYTFFGNADNTKSRSLNYSDTAIMQRVEDARNIVNSDARLKEYKALEEKIVSQDHAWLPMFSRNHFWAVGPNISGFTPNWNGFSDMCYYSVSKQ